MRLVGVGGRPRSGKDTVAALFMEAGYFGVSLGDMARDASRVRHADKPDPISVENMTETANQMRLLHGSDYMLKEALRRFEMSGNRKGLVVYSVRMAVEVDFIRAHNGEVIWVEATDKVRHQRTLANLRPGEAPVTVEEMLRQEALQDSPQPGIPAEVQMNVSYVRERATHIIENNGDDKVEFEARTKQTLWL